MSQDKHGAGGYSMKHIGITILISLAVVVLASPLLRPKGEEAPPLSPEAKEAFRKQSELLKRIHEERLTVYKAGVIPERDIIETKLAWELGRIAELRQQLLQPGDSLSACVVKLAAYRKIHGQLKEVVKYGTIDPRECDIAEIIVGESEIEYAMFPAELKDAPAFRAARAAWEKEPTPANLEKLVAAELSLAPVR